MADELPRSVRETARRLARAARQADEAARDRLRTRRQALVGSYGFRSRIREEPDGDVLVCYPADWIEDGTIDWAAVDDLDRAVERPIEQREDPETWSTIAAHNQDLAEAVRAEHGRVHGANAEAFVDFANNHLARPLASVDDSDVETFLSEYYPRNAWPSDGERAIVEESIALLFDRAEEDGP